MATLRNNNLDFRVHFQGVRTSLIEISQPDANVGKQRRHMRRPAG